MPACRFPLRQRRVIDGGVTAAVGCRRHVKSRVRFSRRCRVAVRVLGAVLDAAVAAVAAPAARSRRGICGCAGTAEESVANAVRGAARPGAGPVDDRAHLRRGGSLRWSRWPRSCQPCAALESSVPREVAASKRTVRPAETSKVTRFLRYRARCRCLRTQNPRRSNLVVVVRGTRQSTCKLPS